MPGDNGYPNVDNYPEPSFKSPVPPPNVDADEGTLMLVAYNPFWGQVLTAACMALLQPATWQGTHDEIVTAQNRANTLMTLLQTPVAPPSDAQTPFWDNDTDVDDSATSELQTWYGFVTDPLAPPGELDFVENFVLWLFTGFVMFSEGVGAAIFFKTNAPKFYIFVRDTNIVELVRIIVDGVQVSSVTTPGTNSGEISVPIVADPSVTTGHEIYIVKAS
jgi:hypothetical protein